MTVFYIVLISYSFYNIYTIIKEATKSIQRFFSFWNIIRFLKVCLMFAWMVLKGYIFYLIRQTIVFTEDTFIDTRELCYWNDAVNTVSSFIITVTFFYFLKHIDQNIVGPVFEVLYTSRLKVVVFITTYSLAIFGFSIFCNFVYGVYIFGKLKLDYLNVLNIFS